MGQYYTPIILAEKGTTVAEFIRLLLSAHCYDNGMKLMEHSYLKNTFVSALEYLISPDGMFYKSRVVWAGDYADKEPNSDTNLYGMANHDEGKFLCPPSHDTSCYRYIVNHTKKQYVDKHQLEHNIHPLPLLTAEGNGRGGGDYTGTNSHLCGTWARDLLSVERDLPDRQYKELVCLFD